jgi:hypothetical protein
LCLWASAADFSTAKQVVSSIGTSLTTSIFYVTLWVTVGAKGKAMETEINIRANVRLAKKLWSPELTSLAIASLKRVIVAHSLSIVEGDLIYLAGKWYVTHTGLLRVALRNRCAGIEAVPVTGFCDPQSRRWAFTATVYKTRTCRGFVGYGDADPSNVSALVRGAEMRVAETRAVNRALRKAYGVGVCSIEEIGSFSNSAERTDEPKKRPPQQTPTNGRNNGSPRVRDHLFQLIRQHELDPVQVKAYAVDFCGTKTLREATREQVENFVAHLANWAEKDRNALLCQLNSYLGAKDGAA